MNRISTLLAIVVVALASEPAYTGAAGAQQTFRTTTEIDTLDASPGAWVAIQQWHADSARAFCVTQYAAWHNYVYVKTLMRAETPDAECATPQTPIFFQAAKCPTPPFQVAREHGPWIIVQCARDRYHRYLRNSPPPSNSKVSPKHGRKESSSDVAISPKGGKTDRAICCRGRNRTAKAECITKYTPGVAEALDSASGMYELVHIAHYAISARLSLHEGAGRAEATILRIRY